MKMSLGVLRILDQTFSSYLLQNKILIKNMNCYLTTNGNPQKLFLNPFKYRVKKQWNMKLLTLGMARLFLTLVKRQMQVIYTLFRGQRLNQPLNYSLFYN